MSRWKCRRCFVQRLGVRGVRGALEVFRCVRGVLLTFKTVVMYGHFDGSRSA